MGADGKIDIFVQNVVIGGFLIRLMECIARIVGQEWTVDRMDELDLKAPLLPDRKNTLISPEEYEKIARARLARILAKGKNMDVRLVRHGHWVYGEDEYGIDGYHCDECGFFIPWDYAHKFINYIEDYHFCPNCGERMDGE